jgi:predicted negative regulator of RcsB-dependent stress response
MVKKKEKENIRKPDMILATMGSAVQFIRNNAKQSIMGLVIFVVVVAAVYAYALNAKNQSDKAQYRLSQGIQSFDTYNVTGKKEDIEKAAAIFGEVAQKKKGESFYIAKLYLGKIDYTLGKREEAKRMYQEVLSGTSSTMLKEVAEKAIGHIEKK